MFVNISSIGCKEDRDSGRPPLYRRRKSLTLPLSDA